jgi:hypothetical protein
VFDKTTTYQKSVKGAQAIATRSAELPPKLRSMLILVDGHRNFEELSTVGNVFGDPAQLLATLEEKGFIEAVGPSAPKAEERRASAPAPLAPVQGAVPLAEAQRYAVRRITDLLGPTGEELCLRIENTKNARDFMAALQRAESVLRDFGGTELARKFAADMESHRPA